MINELYDNLLNKESRFNVSPVILDGKQKVFDMTVSVGCLFKTNNQGELILNESATVGLIKRVMLTICSSFRVKEKDRIFKSEYIIPQLIMLACQREGLDGVAYISSTVSNSGIFGVCAINLALYAKYPNNTFRDKCDRAEIENHIEIDDATNFAFYKQIRQIEPLEDAILWIDRCKWIKNIELHGRQIEYKNTEFYCFDKYLCTSLLKKRNNKWYKQD